MKIYSLLVELIIRIKNTGEAKDLIKINKFFMKIMVKVFLAQIETQAISTIILSKIILLLK
jgi:hypothetical protein